MGMTGRISTENHVPTLESLNSVEYPPPHTYLTFKTQSAEACYSDPRKFGSVTLSTSLSQFDELAPDALAPVDLEELVAGQSMGIKALLLNQKRVVSGVGNWVADEVLYQSRIHPEQTYLTLPQATLLKEKLRLILNTAVACLENREEFPASWLFRCRWSKRSAKSGNKVTDSEGRNVIFLTAAGRTSALVPSIQVKRSQKPKKDSVATSKSQKKRKSGRSHRKEKSESTDENAGNDTEKKAKRQNHVAVPNNMKAKESMTPDKSRHRSSRLSGL